MKQRLKELIWVPVLGLAYFIWLRITGLAVPCVFYEITGWKCPGCGITTLFYRLGRFDVPGAFYANPFLFVTGPLLLAEMAYDLVLRSKGKVLPGWNQTLVWCYCGALIVFGVLRNIL